MPFSRGSSQPRDQTQVSCIVDGFFTAEPPGKLILLALLLAKGGLAPGYAFLGRGLVSSTHLPTLPQASDKLMLLRKTPSDRGCPSPLVHPWHRLRCSGTYSHWTTAPSTSFLLVALNAQWCDWSPSVYKHHGSVGSV